jgi:uncharacterized protein
LGLIYLPFIPVVGWDPKDKNTIAPFSVTAQQYGNFLCRVFDLWLSDFKTGRPTTSVRLFESVFLTCLGHPNPQCAFQETCGQCLVVEHNGDVYPCDFYVEPQWQLGNVTQGGLNKILNSEKQAEFSRLKKMVPESCTDCRYEKYCHGGCTKYRSFGVGPKQRNYFCDSCTQFLEHALPILRRLAVHWQPRAVPQN